jgi:hypothetical protein
VAHRFIEFRETIEDPVTNFLKEISLDHTDVTFSRALVFGFVRPSRQYREAHVIGKITIGPINVGIVQIGLMNPALEVIDHQVRGYPAKVSKHALLDPDEGGKLLIEDKLPKTIRTERQDAQEKLCQGFLAAFSLSDQNTVAEIDLGFFRRLVMEPNSNLLRGGLAAGLFPKRPPKLYIGDFGGHLLSDLFDCCPFAVDLLAHRVPVYLLLPTAVLTGRLCRWLQILPYGSA